MDFACSRRLPLSHPTVDSVEVGQELDPSASLPVTLVEPDVRFARIRRSDQASTLPPTEGCESLPAAGQDPAYPTGDRTLGRHF